MKSLSTTVRTVDELCAHAIVPRDKLGALADVATQIRDGGDFSSLTGPGRVAEWLSG